MKALTNFDLRKQEKKIFIIFVLAILVYTGFVLFADIRKIIQASLHFNWFIVVGILILTFFNYIFRYLRFKYLLKTIDVEMPMKKLFPIFMSGIAMTVTPGKMGEVLKAYLIKQEKGIEFSRLVPILVFERVFDGIAMIMMALGGIFFFRQSILFFIFATGMVVSFFVLVAANKFVLSLIKKFESRFFHAKILDFAVSFFEHSQKLITFKNVLMSVLLGFIAWTLEGISLFWLVSQFTQTGIKDFFYSQFIFAFTSIAGFLVFIPGGVGIVEGSMSSFLTMFFGMTLPQAVFATLIFRFSTLWFGLSLGLIFLLQYLKSNK